MNKQTKGLSVEELLKPRYKVIADYPDSDYEVEAIIPMNSDGYYDYDPTMRAKRMDKYPHLFKLLQWWEERKPEEMPEYIRLNEIMVVKVAKHHCQRFDEFQAQDTKYNYAYGICQPATKDDYLKTKKP